MAQWGRLEDGASCLMAAILNVNDYEFRSITSNMSGRNKFESLDALAKMRLSKRKAATISKLVKEIIGKANERNAIAHSSWYATKKPHIGDRHTYFARGALTWRNEKVSAARLMGFATELEKLNHRMNRALSRAGFFRGKKPDPSRDRPTEETGGWPTVPARPAR